MCQSRLTAEYPALWEHLTCETYPEDGSPRKTSRLSVFLGAYGLQACLDDKEEGKVAFVSSDTLEGLLGALEAGLRENRLDWRVSFEGKKRNSRK